MWNSIEVYFTKFFEEAIFIYIHSQVISQRETYCSKSINDAFVEIISCTFLVCVFYGVPYVLLC